MAAGLGPAWPSARVLANLQQHCIALSYEACQHSSQGTAFQRFLPAWPHAELPLLPIRLDGFTQDSARSLVNVECACRGEQGCEAVRHAADHPGDREASAGGAVQRCGACPG